MAKFAILRQHRCENTSAPAHRAWWSADWFRYGAGVTVIVLAIVLLGSLPARWREVNLAPVYLLAVGLIVLIGGRGPAILAAVIAALLADYWFVGTPRSLNLTDVRREPLEWLALHGLLLAGVLLGLAMDWRHRRALNALRGQEVRYQAVITQAAEGILLFAAGDARIVETNIALQRLLGYTAAELAGLTVYDLIAHNRASIDANVAHILAGQRHELGERRYRRKDGTLLMWR